MADPLLELEADLEGCDLAAGARWTECLDGLTLAQLDRMALRRTLPGLRARLRQVERRRSDAMALRLAAAALEGGLAGREALRAYVVRVTLWTALRRYWGLVRPLTLRRLVAAYDAAQAGRPEWQLRGRRPVELLGDAYLEGHGLAYEAAEGPRMASPAGRLLRLGGFGEIQESDGLTHT